VIIVTARVVIEPGSRDDVMPVLTEVQAASRLDDGCLSYGYFESVDEPGVFSAVEMWRDEEALANHFKQPHIRKLVEALGRYTAEPPTIVAHSVSESRPLT
jgi:quinol monooxygenase YgiN